MVKLLLENKVVIQFTTLFKALFEIDSKIDYLLTIKQLIDKNFSNKDIVEIINIISKDSKKEIYKNVLSIRHEL